MPAGRRSSPPRWTACAPAAQRRAPSSREPQRPSRRRPHVARPPASAHLPAPWRALREGLPPASATPPPLGERSASGCGPLLQRPSRQAGLLRLASLLLLDQQAGQVTLRLALE